MSYKKLKLKNDFIQNCMNIADFHGTLNGEIFTNYGSLIVEKHDDLVDGYVSTPHFQIAHLVDKKVPGSYAGSLDNGGPYLYTKSVSCILVDFGSFESVIRFLIKEHNDNHVFLHNIQKVEGVFRLRYACVPLTYDIPGCNSRARLRDSKIEKILK